MEETKLESFNRKSFVLLSRTNFILNAFEALHKITCPEMYSPSILNFIEKRESTSAPHVKAYWNNKILKLFGEAESLHGLLNNLDEQYFEISVEEIDHILLEMKLKYNLVEVFNPKLN